MEQYLLKNCGTCYLRMKEKGGFEQTLDISEATRFTREKAENIKYNCISPAMRKYWEIVSAEDEPLTQLTLIDGKLELQMFDWKEISDFQLVLFNGLSKYTEHLRGQLSEVDLEICDIQHYMEFYTLDAAKGYKAYRMMKDRLIRRRQIKDEMARADCFISGTSETFSSGRVKHQLDALDNRVYSPSVLNELFELNAS